jgi:DNA-directed RNA polymerase specialized sigma24 family protein
MGAPATSRAGIRNALDGMTPRDRLVLALVLFEGLSTAEAANVLGEPSRRVARDYRSLIASLRRGASAPATARRRNGAARVRRAA